MINISKWQNEYLWLVEQPLDANFRDITFYANTNGSKFMVTIAYTSTPAVMISRFKIAQLDLISLIETPKLPSSDTDSKMM